MKIIKTAKYEKMSASKYYLVIAPDGDNPGTWEVIHNIWPNTQHGGGQVLKQGFNTQEEAVIWAKNYEDENTSISIDDTSFRQRYRELVN